MIAPTLGAIAHGRDNNLNLIRMIAATAVLVSHSFPLTGGPGTTEPLERLTGFSLGFIAVTVFFAISGFLVMRSFERRADIGHWLAARTLRLFPALAVVLVLTAAVLGPLVTTLTQESYLSARATWTYVPANLTLARLQHGLPGVFLANPYPEAINGSLWTLFYEVLCYGLVLVFGLIARRWAIVLLLVGAGLLCVIAVMPEPLFQLPARLAQLSRLAFPFTIGMAACSFRNHLRMDGKVLIGVWAACLIAGLTPVFGAVFLAAISYTALWAGYVPRGVMLAYNRLGDYSYGTYLYAFPVQQTLVHLMPGQTWHTNVLMALPMTWLCAVLSWHLIEARALTLVRRPAASVAAA